MYAPTPSAVNSIPRYLLDALIDEFPIHRRLGLSPVFHHDGLAVVTDLDPHLLLRFTRQPSHELELAAVERGRLITRVANELVPADFEVDVAVRDARFTPVGAIIVVVRVVRSLFPTSAVQAFIKLGVRGAMEQGTHLRLKSQ